MSVRTALAAALAVGAFAVSAAVMNGPADRSHRIPDDASTRFVAATFASGHWVAKAPHEVGAFRPPLVVTRDGRWFGKEYPVLPLLLAPGVRLELDWLVNPLLAGLLVWGTFLLGVRLLDAGAGLVAASFLAVSPAVLSLATTYLNSLLSAAVLVFAVVCALDAVARVSSGRSVLAGFLFGAAFATRPYTVAVMIPALALVPLSAWRERRGAAVRVAGGFLVGCSPWIAAIVAWNVFLSGSPWKTPYQVYAAFNTIGFQAGSHVNYTPANALHDTWRQILAYADGLLPLRWLGRIALGLALVGAVWPPPSRRMALLFATLLLIAGHMLFFGVRSGSWALTGERYYFEATPAVALLTAWLLMRLARWRVAARVGLAVCWASMFLTAIFVSIPAAVAQARSVHDDPFRGSNRRLERFVRELDASQRRLLFVDVSTYNWGSALLVNPPTLDAATLVAIYRMPAQNRAVMSEFPGRDAYLVRWSGSEQKFEMEPYVPERDSVGPPNRFPYTDLRRRGLLGGEGDEG